MSENLNKLFSPVLVVEDLTTAKTIDQYDTGKCFTLGNASGLTVSLPNVADVPSGFFVRFIVKIANTGSDTYLVYVTDGDGDILHGVVISAEDAQGSGDSSSGAGTDVVTFVGGKAQIGDYLDLWTDGTYWYATAVVTQQDAVTYT